MSCVISILLWFFLFRFSLLAFLTLFFSFLCFLLCEIFVCRKSYIKCCRCASFRVIYRHVFSVCDGCCLVTLSPVPHFLILLFWVIHFALGYFCVSISLHCLLLSNASTTRAASFIFVLWTFAACSFFSPICVSKILCTGSFRDFWSAIRPCFHYLHCKYVQDVIFVYANVS